MSKYPTTKVFDGAEWKFSSAHSQKAKAEGIAQKLRYDGFNVKVIFDTKTQEYVVWQRQAKNKGMNNNKTLQNPFILETSMFSSGYLIIGSYITDTAKDSEKYIVKFFPYGRRVDKKDIILYSSKSAAYKKYHELSHIYAIRDK